MDTIVPTVEPAVDSHAQVPPVKTGNVTFAGELAHRLHAWVFVETQASVTLFDRSTLRATVTSAGVTINRMATTDNKELVLQIIWPEALNLPATIAGLTFVPDTAPPDLAPGQWTWSAERNAVALHGQPGAKSFLVAP
jgi:hypothetical protein